MRVAYAIDSLVSGGAQRQAVELAVALLERADVRPVFFVYRDEPFYEDRLREAGIRVHLIRKSAKLDPLFPFRVRSWLKEHPVDVIHAFLHAPCAWCILALAGMRREKRPALICSERDSVIATSPWLKMLHSFIYRNADAVTANAAPVADEIAARCGVPRDCIHYIPNGIDLSAWDRMMDDTSPIRLDPGCFQVALIGRLAPQKDPVLLLKALSRIGPENLADWRVWLIGAESDGTAFPAAVRREVQSRRLADTVRFLPPRRDIAAFIRRLDLLVLPSRHEGFPNVVLEAMASRVPVIATRVGDVPALVAHEQSGLLVPSGDEEALADALLRVYRCGEERRRSMGEFGRRIVEERFQMDSIARAYLKLYESVAR